MRALLAVLRAIHCPGCPKGIADRQADGTYVCRSCGAVFGP